jgi:biopolymer transport protein ExbB/TolQ
MNQLEQWLYSITGIFLTPVLLVLILMFVYALFMLGQFLMEYVQRRTRPERTGPLERVARHHGRIDQEQLELALLKQTEWPLINRIAPMLGLIATMIPMGPALMAVAAGNTQSMADNLVVAFSAVIIALLAASVSYWILSVRKRWLLEELHQLLSQQEAASVPLKEAA